MKSNSANKKLNPKQRRFVDEYLIDLNATQAAIRAGYKEKTARFIGSENLSKPNIQDAIQKAIDARSKRTEVSQDMVIKELLKLGFSDVRQLFTVDGALLSLMDWPDEIAGAVSSIEVDELFDGRGEERHQIGYTKKIKLWDKNSALEKLGKHLKMFTDKIEFPDKDGNPQKVGGVIIYMPDNKRD